MLVIALLRMWPNGAGQAYPQDSKKQRSVESVHFVLLTERWLGLIIGGKIRDDEWWCKSSLIIDQEAIRAFCSHNPRSGMSPRSPCVFTEWLEAWGFVTEIDRIERWCFQPALRCTCVWRAVMFPVRSIWR